MGKKAQVCFWVCPLPSDNGKMKNFSQRDPEGPKMIKNVKGDD